MNLRWALLVVLLGAGLCWASLSVGRPLPQFDLIDANGEMVTSADLEGHALLVTIFDSACKNCQKIFDQLSTIEKQGSVEVILVNVDGVESAAHLLPAPSLKRPIYYPNVKRSDFMGMLSLTAGDLPYAYTTDSSRTLTAAAPAGDFSAAIASPPKDMVQLLAEDQAADLGTSEQEEKRLLALLEHQPNDHVTHHALGKLYGARGDSAHALPHYVAALENGPKTELLHYVNHVLQTVRRILDERDDFQMYLTASGVRLPTPYMQEETDKAIALVKRRMEEYRN